MTRLILVLALIAAASVAVIVVLFRGMVNREGFGLPAVDVAEDERWVGV